MKSGKPKTRASKRRLVENEVIFKSVNQNIKEFVEEEKGTTPATVLPFYCECSNPDCIKRINLSTTQYEKLHKGKNRYVILVGHEYPQVEKVIKKENNLQVVQKLFSPPKPEKIDMALKAIEI